MHGAKAIIAAEPPRRQDLKQRPTIIVASPLATEDEERAQNAEGSGKTKEEKRTKAALPSQELVNPYLPPTDPSPLLKPLAIVGSKESLSSTEHDTYL